MSRPSAKPPRSTLKLPARTTATDTASNTRPAIRRPVRGGLKTAKPSVAASERPADKGAAPIITKRIRPARARFDEPRGSLDGTPGAGKNDGAVPRPHRTAPELTGGGDGPASVGGKLSAPRSEARSPAREPAKTYPKRGIARSTGARALPPARVEGVPRSAARTEPRPAPYDEVKTAPQTAPDLEKHGRTRPRPSASPHAVAPLRQEQASPPAQPHQESPAQLPRPFHPASEPPRLAKRICEMTGCSRREADDWIENGWVKVDGVVVSKLGTRAHAKARIEISEAAGRHVSEGVTIILNKPLEADVETNALESRGDNGLDLLRPENRWAEDDSRFSFKATHLRGLAAAGKLDSDASGMLVFTQEGSVARRIAGDDTRLEKEYQVRVEGELSPADLARLNHGLELDGVKLKHAQVSWQSEGQLRVVLHESRKQQIQRMCELVGLRVIGIKRIRIGSVSLGKLPVGQWRYLRENERF